MATGLSNSLIVAEVDVVLLLKIKPPACDEFVY